uniref:Uncharacterized protein n=1 Tax=Quercus lobata TaxID=97700 RepID=A0A7N2LXV7_QUELO
MTIQFSEYQACAIVFITAQSYVDIASISVGPRTSGGQTDHNKELKARQKLSGIPYSIPGVLLILNY